MNTRLEMLFEKHHVSEKDRYEIGQFFGLLPDNKKKNLINNFEILILRVNKIREDLNQEREILVPNLINKIEAAFKRAELRELKKEIK